MRKILLIEDDESIVFFYNQEFLDLFGGTLEIHCATNFQEAQVEIGDGNHFDVICFDGNIPLSASMQRKELTVSLVEEAKQNSTAPFLVAASSVFNLDLIQAGCNAHCKEKFDLPKKVQELLAMLPVI